MEEVIIALLIMGIAFLLFGLPLLLSIILLFKHKSAVRRLEQLEKRIGNCEQNVNPKKLKITNKAPDKAVPAAAARTAKPSVVIEPTPEEPVAAAARQLAARQNLVEQPPTATGASAKPGNGKMLELFIGQRLFAFLGIAFILLAVAFSLPWMLKHFSFSIRLRLLGAVGFGSALLLAGVWWHRQEKLRFFADVLMGGGVGVLYLTSFAAFQIYHLVSQATAGAFLLAVASLALILANIYGSQIIALIGTAGAFAMPFAVRSGSAHHDFFLGYLLAVNLPVMILGLRRRWQWLYNLSFAASVAIGIAWTMRYFNVAASEHFPRACWFWGLLAAEYLALGLLKLKSEEHIIARSADFLRLILVTLILGIFGWYLPMHRGWNQELPYIFAAMALIYAGISAFIHRWRPAMNGETMLFFGGAAGFLATAVPLRFDGAWIAVLWAIEASALTAFSLKNKSRGIRSLAMTILGLACGHAILINLDGSQLDRYFILNHYCGTVFVIAVLCAIQAGLAMNKSRTRTESDYFASSLIALGSLLIIIAVLINSYRYFKIFEYAGLSGATAVLGITVIWMWLGHKIPRLQTLAQAAPALTAMTVIISLQSLFIQGFGAGPASPWFFSAWSAIALLTVWTSPQSKKMLPGAIVLGASGLLKSISLNPELFASPQRFLFNQQFASSLCSCIAFALTAYRPLCRKQKDDEKASYEGNTLTMLMPLTAILLLAVFVAIDSWRIYDIVETSLLLSEAAFLVCAGVLLLIPLPGPQFKLWRRFGAILLLMVIITLFIGDIVLLPKATGSALANRWWLAKTAILATAVAIIIFGGKRDLCIHPNFRILTMLAAATAGLGIVATELSRLHQSYQIPQDWSTMAVTIWISSFAVICCGLGIWRRSRPLRYYGFCVLGLGIIRILHSIWELDDPQRIIAMLGTGILILALSFAYHKVASAWLQTQ